jgi:hypothetical protein
MPGLQYGHVPRKLTLPFRAPVPAAVSFNAKVDPAVMVNPAALFRGSAGRTQFERNYARAGVVRELVHRNG